MKTATHTLNQFAAMASMFVRQPRQALLVLPLISEHYLRRELFQLLLLVHFLFSLPNLNCFRLM